MLEEDIWGWGLGFTPQATGGVCASGANLGSQKGAAGLDKCWLSIKKLHVCFSPLYEVWGTLLCVLNLLFGYNQ